MPRQNAIFVAPRTGTGKGESRRLPRITQRLAALQVRESEFNLRAEPLYPKASGVVTGGDLAPARTSFADESQAGSCHGNGAA